MAMDLARINTVNVGETERKVSLALGGLLAVSALTQPRKRLLKMATSSYLLFRGATGYCSAYEVLGINTLEPAEERLAAVPGSGGLRVEKAVTVNAAREEVYRFWRQLENLPRFMQHLESVSAGDNGRSHWVAKAPLEVEWDAEITGERENEMIAWRSVEGSQIDTVGTVQFREAPGGRGTEVHVTMEYAPPGGPAGALAARMLKAVTEEQIKQDLGRFKAILEAGEAPTVEGQPSGRRQEGIVATIKEKVS